MNAFNHFIKKPQQVILILILFLLSNITTVGATPNTVTITAVGLGGLKGPASFLVSH